MPPMSFLTGNPGVAVTLALLVIGGLVSTAAAIAMGTAGSFSAPHACL